jgi:hypothetical protein
MMREDRNDERNRLLYRPFPNKGLGTCLLRLMNHTMATINCKFPRANLTGKLEQGNRSHENSFTVRA